MQRAFQNAGRQPPRSARAASTKLRSAGKTRTRRSLAELEVLGVISIALKPTLELARPSNLVPMCVSLVALTLTSCRIDYDPLPSESDCCVECWTNTRGADATRLREISIQPSTSDLIDYPVKITVGFDSDMQSDFRDLRFFDAADAPLNYWLEDYSASVQATVWVQVPSIAQGASTSIQMLYGSRSAASKSNGEATFPFFDDFETASVNTSQWNVMGTPSVSDGQLTVQNPTTSDFEYLSSIDAWGSRKALRVRGALGDKSSNTQSGRHNKWFGWESLPGTQTDSRVTAINQVDLGFSALTIAQAGDDEGTEYHDLAADYTGDRVFEIARTVSEDRFYVSDVLEVTATAFNSGDISRHIVIQAARVLLPMSFDWVLVRDYASPEPSAIVGPEIAACTAP